MNQKIMFKLNQGQRSAKLLSKLFSFFFVFAVVFGIGVLFFNVQEVKAADCGDTTGDGVTDTACVCGDTVIGVSGYAYELTGNLTCTGHGLLFGNDSITLDGGGHTITGDRDEGDYGIYNNGFNYATTTNFTINDFGRGVYYKNADNGYITSNTANSNSYYGIYLYSSSGNILTSNTMLDNTYNFYISGNYDNNINTTNLVQSKPVYYLYNQNGTAETPLVYDGDELGDIGMFLAIDCEYIKIKNATLSSNNRYGIYFENTANSTIENINASNSNYGIYFDSSSDNTLISNTANSNSEDGIHLKLSSDNNTLTDNTANLNAKYGIYIFYSFNNTLTSNIISNNINDIIDLYSDGSNTYSSNQLLHNTNSKMLTWIDIERKKNIDDNIAFNFSMFDINGNALSIDPIVTIYPNETVVTERSNNNATSTFTATKNGIYSLEIQSIDSDNNAVKRRFSFLVGDTGSETIRYYLRDANPTHNQPKNIPPHRDAKALLLFPPTQEEWWQCGLWIQNSPDELPPLYYSVNFLTDINIHSWYKTTQDGWIGIQRFAIFNSNADYSQNVIAQADYTEIDINFSDINWLMNYPKDWYWLSLKLKGVSGNPHWRSSPENLSYADFVYSYTTNPAIKSISNEDIIVLSATTDSNIASISLENPTSVIATTNLTLTDFNYPFLDAISSIDSTATTTITSPNIGVRATTTINSLNLPITVPTGSVEVLSTDNLIDLDYHNSTLTGLTINNIDRETNLNNQNSASMIITPALDSVNLSIDTWNTSGTYYKKWTASSTESSMSVDYTIGDLEADQYYTISYTKSEQEKTFLQTIQADSSGQISFTYDKGFSEIDFEIEEDTTAPAAFILSSPANNDSTSDRTPTFSWNASSDTESGLAKYQLYIDNSLDTDNIISSSASATPANNLSCGSHTWFVRAIDNAGNTTDSNTFNLTMSCGSIPVWLLKEMNQNKNQTNDSDNKADDNENQNVKENNNDDETEITKEKIFVYNKSRLKSLAKEKNLAKGLKQELENHYGENKIPLHKKHWHTIVNFYVYGNYPIQAIIKAIKFGGKTVHPDIPFSAWKKAMDYLEWIGK